MSKIKDEFSGCDSDVRLDGKVALVTGGSTGIGLEVAKNLSMRGAKVIIASRNATKLEAAREEITKASGRHDIVTRQMDFASLKSIRNFAAETINTEPRLNILVNNVGAVGLDERLTRDHLHPMMQVNYFGTFLLTYLLFPLLKKSAPSRIVNVSSIAQLLGTIEFDHWNDLNRHSNFGYYANAKLAMTLFTVEMDRMVRGSGVKVYSMDPGMTKTDIPGRYYDIEFLNKILLAVFRKFGRPADRAATLIVLLAADPRVENDSGKHFRDCKEFYSTRYANDTVFRENLWRETKKLVGLNGTQEWESVVSD